MGIQSSMLSDEYYVFKSNYNKEVHERNFVIGNYSHFQHRLIPQIYILEKQVNFKSMEDYEIFVQNLKKFEILQHKNLANLKYHSQIKNLSCLEMNISHVVACEYYPFNLAQLIQNKECQKEGKVFSQENSAYLLVSILDIFQQFNNNELPIGYLTLENIIINQDGDILLLSSTLFNQISKKKFLGKENFQQEMIYSPEELDLLKNDRYNQKQFFDNINSKVFELAILILSFSCKCEISKFYDYFSQNVRFDKITEKLNQLVKHGYSKSYTNLLSKMLCENYNQRITLKQLMSQIKDLQQPNFSAISINYN